MRNETLTTLRNGNIVSMRRLDYDPQNGYVQNLANELAGTVYGQEDAMKSLARTVARFQSGLSDPNRPLGVLFFLGPTGVGKTEAAFALGSYLFEDRKSPQIKKINCAEFSESHTAMRLTGAPPSYVGYNDDPLLTPDFLSKTNVLLFDEVEKAHPQFHRSLLSITDKASLTAKIKGKEQELDFSNSIIILTSNLGSDRLSDQKTGKSKLGFNLDQEEKKKDEAQEIVMKALRDHFRYMPEFLGRINEFIVFAELGKEQYDLIFWKFLKEINDVRASRNPNASFISATVECKDWLLKQVDYAYGARGVRHVIEKKVLEPASDVILGGALPPRSLLVAAVVDDELAFYTDQVTEDKNRQTTRQVTVYQPQRVPFFYQNKNQIMPQMT